MLTTVVLLSFIAAAFWREALKLVVAGFIVLLALGAVQLIQIIGDTDVTAPANDATQPVDRD